MNDGTLSPTLIAPLTSPAEPPTPTASRVAAQNGHCQSASATPSTAPDSATTEPTERSIMPEMRMSVIPVETTTSVGMRLASVPKVRTDRKCSLSRLKSRSRVPRMARDVTRSAIQRRDVRAEVMRKGRRPGRKRSR
ncbi:MAG: hypothetical protein H7138_23925 [Myxococcales bacterium]|nr:hypothetical protein [Myxococcales bacterium]